MSQAFGRGSPGVTDSLDGLRGLFAVWVMLSHINQFTDGPGGLINRGGIAVDLFMFVSGFLMVWTVSSREAKEPSTEFGTWRKFFIRRFFRIAPLYFVLLAVAYSFEADFSRLIVDVYAALGQGFDRPFLRCAPTTFVDVLAHVSFLSGIFPCTAASNILPDWSLSLEMQFYLVFPLLYLAVKGKHGLLLAILAVVIAGVSQRVVHVYSFDPAAFISYPQPSLLPLRINCFLAGMLLAHVVWEKSANRVVVFALILCTLAFQRMTFTGIASLLILMFFARVDLWLRWDSVIAAPLRAVEAVLRLRFMRYLGDVSFGVYLIHIPLLLPLVAALNRTASFSSLNGDNKFLVVTLIGFPLVLACAAALHRFVEMPMIDLGRRLTARRLPMNAT